MSSEGNTKSGPTPMSGLRREDGVALLDTIDKLRSLGVDQEIPLPQIVVVGQQSSGKSSVLEAISGIPFPTNDGLCTRFATEVILRRAPTASTKIQIIRTTQASHGDQKTQTDEFQNYLKSMEPFEVDKVPEIVAHAAKALNLDGKQNFARDFLRIEVTGPKQDHITLVDLPGLFYYTKTGQNSAEPTIVKDLALRYMSEKRSVILAVLSAKTDYSTQEILQTLKTIDPTGSRTLGIITGVDQVERHSTRESDYLALADNDTTPLALGWHVLRNPSFTERQSGHSRDSLEEKFFQSQQPWSGIEPQNQGASQLKQKLSRILMAHIGRELNDVMATLNLKIDEHEKILSKCGTERSTPQQQRLYLGDISEGYRKLVKAALEGPYEDTFFSSTAWRLRAKVRQRSEDFVRDMEKYGHRWEIFDSNNITDPTGFGFGYLGLENQKIGDRNGKPSSALPIKLTGKEYLSKVDDVLRDYRGRELQGTFDPLLIGVLFRDQSCAWRRFAERFAVDIVHMLSSFVEKVVEHLTDAKYTRAMLTDRLQAVLRTRRQSMKSRLDVILKPFEKLYPMTYNPLLRARLHGTETYQSIDDKSGILSAAGTDDAACQMLMENMKSYYSIALPTFVDNVTTLGIELCLLDGLEDIFSPTSVLRMSDTEITKLASESDEDVLHRRTTEKRLQKLKAGRDVCQEHAVPEIRVDETTTSTTQKPSVQISSTGAGSAPRPRSRSPRPSPKPTAVSPSPSLFSFGGNTGSLFGSTPSQHAHPPLFRSSSHEKFTFPAPSTQGLGATAPSIFAPKGLPQASQA